MLAHQSSSVPLKKTRLTDRQCALVGQLKVIDNRAVFEGEQIDDWPALKKVMTVLGGTWKKGSKGALGGFVFADDVDAAELVRLAWKTGEILDPNAHDFFPTPDGLADRVAVYAQIGAGMSVLEPSAGKGALALAVQRRCPTAQVVCVELLAANEKALRAAGLAMVFARDFLGCKPEHFADFDRVVMNPPFSKRLDIAHVRHAFDFLKSGGRLVAIMSSGVAHRSDSLALNFRALVANNGGHIEENPAGSFKVSGTMVGTVTVVLPKRGA